MASKIEHCAKWDAYLATVAWGKGLDDKESILHLPKEKMKAHKQYIDEMNASGKYYYGSPPKSKLLNWLGHKCLEIAWGKRIYE